MQGIAYPYIAMGVGVTLLLLRYRFSGNRAFRGVDPGFPPK